MKRWIPIFVVLALLLTMPGFAFAADESSDAKKLSLSGHAEGFGDADLWISGTALDAVANITEDDMLLLRVDGVVRGEPVNAVLGIKEDGVYLAFPDAMEEKYFVSMDTLTDVFGDKADDYGVHITAGKVDVGEVLSDLEMEKLTESLGKYFSIIAGFVKEENTVTVSGDYELAGLGEMVTGEYVIFTPTKEDWSNLIKDLLTTLQSDEEMMQLLEKGITATAKEEGTSPEETMQTIRDLIASGIENADTYANFLSSLRFTLVKTENGSIACVKAEMPGMFGVGYEGFGSLEDTRRDAIVMYDLSGAEVLALNTLTMSENGIMGKLTVVICWMQKYDMLSVTGLLTSAFMQAWVKRSVHSLPWQMQKRVCWQKPFITPLMLKQKKSSSLLLTYLSRIQMNRLNFLMVTGRN